MSKDGPGLYIPTPRGRPGDQPDFSYLKIPAAGAVRRPPPDAPEEMVRDLPYELIRVLNENNEAVGEWATPIDVDILRAGLRAMVMSRIIDERMFRAHRQGKACFYAGSTGEEAVAAAPALVLGPDDMTFSSYRSLSWLMARGYPLPDLFNQLFSNSADPLKGRQMTILYSAREQGFYSLSGNVGSRFGHAVGWAMASAYKKAGRVAIAHIGDGTSAEGDFHEALTFASTYRAPAILCIVNNQWAISTFSGVASGQAPTFAAKALGYGIPGLRVDGNDFLAVASVTRWAAERARSGLGATLIELFTYRAEGHSTSDDPNKYRPSGEAGAWPLGDPIARLKEHLIRIGAWSEQRHIQFEAELLDTIRTAQKGAEAIGTFGQSKPNLREMFEGVFKEPDWRVKEQRIELGI